MVSSGQVSGDLSRCPRPGEDCSQVTVRSLQRQDNLRPAQDILGGRMFKLLGSTQNMGVTWAQTVTSGFPKEGACDKSHCIKTNQVPSVFRRSTLDLLYILFQLLPIFPVCRESFLECSIHCSSFPRSFTFPLPSICLLSYANLLNPLWESHQSPLWCQNLWMLFQPHLTQLFNSIGHR